MSTIMLICKIILGAVHLYSILMLAYCILSWFPQSRGSGALGKTYRVLGKICDPYLNIFRKIIPAIGGTVDVSPIIGIVLLEAVANFLVRFLLGLTF